ncbi:type II toxin-antitoxin system Phd/YefM family antitoxin [Candidatus Gottesmanbacteria bacterium]|nr:type II toxin-antitoxin system Phd/YefM family antitoxin [Candidatus Gottesmanbacteria bacterium]
MTTVSISQLKTNPSEVISQAYDYPVAVEKRNEVKAYLIGRELFEKIVAYLEDYIDRKAIEKTNFKEARDFEKVARDLGL